MSALTSIQFTPILLKGVSAVFLYQGGDHLVQGVKKYLSSDERAKLPSDVVTLMDSQYRFLGGMYMGLGAIVGWTTFDISERHVPLAVIMGTIVLAGIARAVSGAVFGWAFPWLRRATIVEIVVESELARSRLENTSLDSSINLESLLEPGMAEKTFEELDSLVREKTGTTMVILYQEQLKEMIRTKESREQKEERLLIKQDCLLYVYIMTDTYDLRWKVLLLGDSTVGKTNIVNQFTQAQLDAESKPTLGVKPTNKIVQVGSDAVKVNIWDTAGLERYRASVNYYHDAVAVLIVYDVTNRKSFDNAARWLQEIRTHGEPGITVMLVGNKSDLGNLRVVETQRAVRTEEASLFARENKIPFAEISAKYASQVETTFQTLFNNISKKISAGSS
ncbi:unnamed protein product [Fusarium graminearum]|nr:unnamed protein product [Fusarium graminearum]